MIRPTLSFVAADPLRLPGKSLLWACADQIAVNSIDNLQAP